MRRIDKDRMLSDLMSITVECADAKVVSESLLIREKVAQKELQLLRDQIDLLGRNRCEVRDSATTGGGGIWDVPEFPYQGVPNQLVSDTVHNQRQMQQQSSDNSRPLLLEIFKLTASLDMKEETIQHLYQKLSEASTGAAAVAGTGEGEGTVAGSGGGATDSSPSSDVDFSPYKELFVNSEAEMMRLKVREVERTILLYLYSTRLYSTSILFNLQKINRVAILWREI